MIVTVSRTCVLLARVDMITQMINTHIEGTQSTVISVSKHGNRHPEEGMEATQDCTIFWYKKSLLGCKMTKFSK